MVENGPEVLVAGAGPVGLFGALALARRGIRLQIVDTGVWACTHSYALALHPQSIELLRRYELGGSITESAQAVRRLALFDRDGQRGEIALNGSMAVLRQDVFESELERALQSHGVRVQWRHEVSDLRPGMRHVTAAVDRYERESRGYVVAHSEWVVGKTITQDIPFVLGADGYNSRVRRALGIDFPEVGPAAYYAVFEFRSDARLDHEMRIVFGDGTTDVLWPLPEGFCRWSFQLTDYSDPQAEALKQYLSDSGQGNFPTKRAKDRRLTPEANYPAILEPGRLEQFIRERAPWFRGSVDDITWRTVVRFERRLADSFGRDRMWLAGDAAHLTGPIGVQSMNLGLAEVDDLAERISRSLRGGRAENEMAGFNERWVPEWRRLHGLEATPSVTGDPFLARHAAELPACLPAHGEELTRLSAQVGLQL